jgi:O-acetyl-ADP-ribose deacetylase (regulator of RNase III)
MVEVVEIFAKKGDITEEKADAIVNPANSLARMGGGVALAIKLKGGQEIEEEAMKRAPIPLGSALATTAGKLSAKFIIHAPTMKKPAERIKLENVKQAMIAALKCASELNIKAMAFPGMGTGVGGIEKKEAAEVMVNAIKKFFREGETTLEKVILVGYDDELYEEFKKSLKK